MLRAVDFLCLVLVFNPYLINGGDPVKCSSKNDGNCLDQTCGRPLILSPFIRLKWIEIGRILARVHLEGAENIESYSGYLEVDRSLKTNLFFWFFPSKSNFKNDPVILWLEGGLENSIMFGIFAGHGPFLVDGRNKLKLRDISWINRHSVLYIDNSFSGFSFYETIGEWTQSKMVSELYNAVYQFFQLFPELQKNEFYIAGQSYAASFVMSLSNIIMKTYDAEEKITINLTGIAIGNAMIDPLRQSKYGNYLFQLGFINETELMDYLSIEESITNCLGNQDDSAAIDSLIKLQSRFLSNTENINPLNYIDDKNSKKVLLESYLPYILQPGIRRAIHVGNEQFNSGLTVYNDMIQLISDNADFNIMELLKQYRILFYTGQLDTFVSPARVSEYLKSLNISKPIRYETACRYPWNVNKKLAGYVKIVGNLTELTVREAGQMVPLDQPEWALDMITRFTRGERLLW